MNPPRLFLLFCRERGRGGRGEEGERGKARIGEGGNLFSFGGFC